MLVFIRRNGKVRHRRQTSCACASQHVYHPGFGEWDYAKEYVYSHSNIDSERLPDTYPIERVTVREQDNNGNDAG